MAQRTIGQLEALQERLRYRFTDAGLLHEALVHRSFLNEPEGTGLVSNERLEFLGDAILGAVVSRRLFLEFPDADEGWMTMARSRLVRMETLARIGREIGIGTLLRMGAGIAHDGGRERDTVLCRALEALCGAVWLDGGDEAAERVILLLVERELSALDDAGITQDPKSALQHVTQSRDGTAPTYEIVGMDGPQHEPWFRARVLVEGEPLAEGEGTTKQAAEMDAARLALSMLRQETG